MDTVFNMLDTNSNKFYFDESNKKEDNCLSNI